MHKIIHKVELHLTFFLFFSSLLTSPEIMATVANVQ